MSESEWDNKVRAFLKKTGEDLKRAGNDIRVEAERLVTEVQDPENQAKIREGLSTFKVWARKTAEEVAGVVETGMKKAETAVRGTVDTKPPQKQASEEPPRHDTPIDTPAAEDPGPGAPAKKPGSKKKAAKKPLGRKR